MFRFQAAGRRRLLVALVALTIAGTVGVWYWTAQRAARVAVVASAPLPALTESPYLNTRPGVKYVGDEACAGCHRDIQRTYHQHPMGRSLFAGADAPVIENLTAAANNPFQVGSLHFAVRREGARLIHREWCADADGKVVAELEAPIAYAVGSGTQARSYLIERDGQLYQSPLTWYVGPGQWGLSPGYEQAQQHFERRIHTRCLYCHAQEPRPVDDTLNRYEQPAFGQHAIGCERCHGPGELHVAQRRRGELPAGLDWTIVNPTRLPAELREAVCAQCHLQGEEIVVRRGRRQTDYRPGLPLEEYLAVFVRAPEADDAGLIVGHVEQLQHSACFRKSDGKFGCLSCHDAHQALAPAARPAFYRQRCVRCHADAVAVADSAVPAPVCALPAAERTARAPGDNCVQCHMPSDRSSNVPHLAVTDHRVPRVAQPRRPTAPRTGVGTLPLRLFHEERRSTDDDLGRDLGLALIDKAQLAQSLGATAVRDALVLRAQPLLERAAARAPDDWPAVEGYSFALFNQGKRDEALGLAGSVLKRVPRREPALALAAGYADGLGRFELAERYAQQLAEQHPDDAGYHHELALIRSQRERFADALPAAEAAVRGNPFRSESRALLVTCYLETGQRQRASTEFAKLAVIDPAYHAKLRPWFAARLSQAK